MTQWIEFLYDALASDYGVVVKTNDCIKAKAALYREIKRQKDPNLEELTIRTSPDDPRGEIWIMKKGKPNGTVKSEHKNEEQSERGDT